MSFNKQLSDVETSLATYKRSPTLALLKRYFRFFKKLNTYGQGFVYIVEVKQGYLYILAENLQDANDIMAIQYAGYTVLTIREITAKRLYPGPFRT